MRRSMSMFLAFFFLVFSAESIAATYTVPGDFLTINEAIKSPLVVQGDTIIVGPGEHTGAEIDKAVTIKGEGGATISNGPNHPSGLVMGFPLVSGSDGATISHLRFTVDLAVMNRGAVNDVTVTHCAFENAIQAVSNWGGSGWEISHNTITDLRTRNGGGIGILVADRLGGVVENNVVSHNKVTGTLRPGPGELGGYSGSGIVFYADFRWNMPGTQCLCYNRAVKNKVAIISEHPDLVDVVAFELTDTLHTGCGEAELVIHDNAVGFNDFRGTGSQIVLTPECLSEFNDISRNLGDNRGHGLHPKVFGADD